MARVPMTELGLKKLKKELSHLTQNERPAVIKAIAEAAAHGDLSENAEYHAARERQSFIEGRVAQLEEALQNAEIVSLADMKGREDIGFGAQVKLVDEETEKSVEYRIVSHIEADPEGNLISQKSPLAQALMGRRKGDSVEVVLPNEGVRYYYIDCVAYAA